MNLLITLWIEILFSFATFHPVHVSMTNLEYEQQENAIHFSCKLFKDDFQEIIKKKYGVKLDLKEAITVEEKDIITNYIEEKLIIQGNGKSSGNPKFINHKLNEESVWLFFICNLENGTKQLIVTNLLLLDMFDDQKNLIIFKNGKREKGYMLNKDKVSIELRL